ncbi:MAG TPA: protein kinase [Ktedonobacteraceae bacterium]
MVEHSAFDKLTGATLGNYLLEQLIERSEAGSVFIARNNATETRFRLRILAVPPNLAPEDRIVYLGRFQQEPNQVAYLQHTHILPLVDYATRSPAGDPEGPSWPYLVSPYLPMKSLSAHLAKKGPVDAVLASRYLDQIASALEYAHQKGVLHRNLTTECIFISQDGNLLVADFGVIRMLDAGARFTTPGTIKGVYGMNEASAPAPEQILGQAIDTYTDVYALGAVLYRLLTGHRVFRGKTREELIEQHLQAQIPSLATWRDDLPTALDDVIARAMAKEPAQRYRQPGEVANAYHQVVTPQDTQRTPFFVASVPTISGQPQEVHSGLGDRAKGGDVQSRDAQQGGRVQPGGDKPRPNVTRDAGDRRGPHAAPISRRRFIVAGGGVAAAVLAVAIFGRNYLAGNTSPADTSPANTPVANTPVANTTGGSSNVQVLARTSEIPSNSAKTFPISGNNNPGLLIHLPDGRFVAFDSTCTHAGCAVNYIPQDKIMKCPCHSAEFDPAKNAAVIQGPAQTPLAAIKISVNADGTITQG